MRLEGQAKLGYYPTPEQTLSHLVTWLRTDGEGLRRYLDPCCGKGEALAAITIAHNPAESYGIELSDVRAETAAKCLTHVLPAGYENAVLTDETFSLVLLNPPYDGEGTTGGGVRLEETFLLNTTARLVSGGVLIYLIPHARLSEKIARHLAGWYAELQCFKLPQAEYGVFKQVILFGTRRRDYHAPKGKQLETLNQWRDGKELTYLTAGNGAYAIPPCSPRGKHNAAFRFQYMPVTDEDMRREALGATGQLSATRAWCDLIPPTTPLTITPAMTPKKGHIGPQLLSGLLGTNRVTTPQNTPLLLKGHIHKRRETTFGDEVPDDLPADDEKRHLFRVETKERFEAMLTTLTAEDGLTRTTDPQAIGQLLEQYVQPLAEMVQIHNQPRYDLHPEAWEWAAFQPLSTGRRLPGRNETGLTEFQRHLAVAMGRLCLATGAGLINAEMASGKSTILLGVVEYLWNAYQQNNTGRSPYPALIVGPGIVTGQENWPKEIREVIPNAESRVVTVSAKPLPKPIKLGQWLASLGVQIADETHFMFDVPASLREQTALVRIFTVKIEALAKKQKVTLTDAMRQGLRDSLRRAVVHPPKRRANVQRPNVLDGRIGGSYAWLGLDIARDEDQRRELSSEYSLAQFVSEYQAGILPEKSFAVLSFETAKLSAGRVPAMGSRWIRFERQEDDEVWSELVQVATCSSCGAVVSEKYDPDNGAPLRPILVGEVENWVGSRRRFCAAPVQSFNRQSQRYEAGKWVYDAELGRTVVRAFSANDQPYVCGQPLFEETALRREAAARYALKKLKGVFGALAVDEVHKCKAKGTGVGWVLQALTNVCRYTVGLTGTLFGGYSTSIFWLLYRLSGKVRAEFGFDDEQRWAKKYGLLKSVFYVQEDDELAEDGAFTGRKHFETVSELPGISPAIVGVGLEHATFSSLKDIGLPLPTYSEQIVRIPLTDDMRAQLAEADGSQSQPPDGLLAWALNEQKKKDGKGAVSVWLNAALNRPDAMFREEQIWFNRRTAGRGRYAVRQRELVKDLPAVTGELLPKETWLLETCTAEKRAGRKVLVYVRQTGERDIQPRLVELLQAQGLRVAILKPSLAPAKRATWIKHHADKVDVLLTNSRLVEVGLNLTMFQTGIFYEIEWSLYVLWQAMRRLYRPGATRPVTMYFPVYEGALEETALNLIGAKMKAAQMFYGDEVGGALVEEDDGDLLNALVRQALGGVAVGRAESLFMPEPEANSEAPITTLTPRTVTLMDLWAQKQSVLRAKRRMANEATPETQMALF